jgi:hypothetical protein
MGRAPVAECGRPRPLPCPNCDARSPIRRRPVLPRCSARGRAHSGLTDGARVVSTRSARFWHDDRNAFNRSLEWSRAADWGQSARRLRRDAALEARVFDKICLVAKRRRKLASYAVAGHGEKQFVLKGRWKCAKEMADEYFRRPFRTDFV